MLPDGVCEVPVCGVVEIAFGIADLQEADAVHAALIPELEFVLAVDLIHAGIQVVGVQRVLKNRKGLRSEVLAAHGLVSVAKLDVGRGDVAGGQTCIAAGRAWSPG